MLNAQQLPDPKLPWPITMVGVSMIAEYEQGPGGGVALRAYRCPAGVWTCGWGETAGVGPESRWTKHYADQRFCDSLGERVAAVRAMVTAPATAHQLAALVSLAYNIGNAGLQRSSVLMAHNRGDPLAAARSFALWNKATVNGALTVLPGLVARRAREAALYLTPDPDAAPAATMPQSVEPESSLARSPIANSGALTAATGVITAVMGMGETSAPAAPIQTTAPSPAAAVAKVEAVGQQAQQIKTATQQVRDLATETLGIPPGSVLPAVLIAAGIAVIYWRYRQRRDGWA
jgi:lysozyme